MISKLGNGMKKVQQLTRVQMQGLLTTYLPQNKFCTAVETLTEMKSLDLQSQSSLSNLLERDPTNPRYKNGLKVINSIQKEWKFETKENDYIPRQETIEYLKKHKYTWIEEPKNSRIVLQKTAQEYLIELKRRDAAPVEEKKLTLEDFDLDKMPPHTRAYLYSMMEKQNLEDEKKDTNGLQGFKPKQMVQIEVKNNNSGDKLYFVAYIADGEVTLHHVRLFSSRALGSGLKGVRLFGHRNYYQGVNFHVLSEGLQKGFVSFIEGLGIESEVFYHIEYLGLNREQRLYLEWLKNLYDFTKKDLLSQK